MKAPYQMYCLRSKPRTFWSISILVAIAFVSVHNAFMMGTADRRSRVTSISTSSAKPHWRQYATFDPAAPIPRNIWQTYRTSNLSDEAAEAVSSWTEMNANLSMMLHDDAAADEFILNVFGPDVHATYASFPVGVMRADFWRYAILYAMGGIYSDIDTECLQPLDDWFPARKPTNAIDVTDGSSWSPAGGLRYDSVTWADCSLVVALENGVHMCQWTIASVPGHPVLATVLELILERAAQGIETKNDHFVHHHTGPGIWTDAVRLSLGLSPDHDTAALLKLAWTDVGVYRRARSMGICVMPEWFFGTDYAVNVRNLYASLNFDSKTYVRWQDEKHQITSSYTAGKS